MSDDEIALLFWLIVGRALMWAPLVAILILFGFAAGSLACVSMLGMRWCQAVRDEARDRIGRP